MRRDPQVVVANHQALALPVGPNLAIGLRGCFKKRHVIMRGGSESSIDLAKANDREPVGTALPSEIPALLWLVFVPSRDGNLIGQGGEKPESASHNARLSLGTISFAAA